MTDRVKALREAIDKMNAAGVRRTHFYTLAYESLIETRDESIQMRRAKAQAHILDHAPIALIDHELIAGSVSAYCPVQNTMPDISTQQKMARAILDKYLLERDQRNHTKKASGIRTFEDDFTTKKSRWALMSRVYHDASISYEALQSLIREMTTSYEGTLEPYEIGRELERGFKLDYGANIKREIDLLPWYAANHLSLNYAQLIKEGFGARIQIINNLAKSNANEFYEAQLIVLNASTRFFKRYAQLAQDNGLPDTASRLKRLAEQPAETFTDAVQFIWMLHVMMTMLRGSALSFGRLDQYLFSYYERDIRSGLITRAEAEEWLSCLWLKINEPNMRTVQSVTLGGITPKGDDAVNDLTYACLSVVKDLQLPYPNVGARVHPVNPIAYRKQLIDCVATGAGQPMLMADTVWIENLKRLGYADKYANDYYNMGCVEIMIPNKQPNWGVTEPIAFPMLFESVFEQYKGREDDLSDFEKFKAAYFDILENAVAQDHQEALIKQADKANKCYDPFASMMIDGCIQSGKDMFQGGAELGTHWSFYAYGLGTASDSMMAVKQFVYDEKCMHLSELGAMLRNNFDRYEAERKLLQSAAHYGNDIDSVDQLAKEILSRFDDQVFSYNDPAVAEKYVTTLFGYFFHIYHGEITGATANGRLRGEPFSDSMGPSQGQDSLGPTKLLNSVLKFDHSKVTGGYALNVKLNPSLIRGAVGKNALSIMLFTYLEDGGPQVQLNFVDADTLKEAKQHPEKHRNLIVRIGGYCEYFVNLDAALQDEIITRTVHGL